MLHPSPATSNNTPRSFSVASSDGEDNFLITKEDLINDIRIPLFKTQSKYLQQECIDQANKNIRYFSNLNL